MGYDTSTSPKRGPEGGLCARTDHLLERLSKIQVRVSMVTDRLIGTAPSEVDGDNKVSSVTIQNNINIAHNLITRIDTELDRLEGGL